MNRFRIPSSLARRYAIDDLIFPDWTPQQRADFTDGLARAKTDVNVAVTGKTGTGKSTLINALCGAVPKEAVEYCDDGSGRVVQSELYAKEGNDLSSKTTIVSGYEAQKASLGDRMYTITVWDSPGMEDGTGAGLSYVQSLGEECSGGVDILLYCINVSGTRDIMEEMVPGMSAVSQTLGPEIWRHTIVVFTMANILEERIIDDLEEMTNGEQTGHDFASRIKHWEQNVRIALVKAGAPDDIARDVLVELAGSYRCVDLPDRPHWLGWLWLQLLLRARNEAKLAIVITNQHRIRDADLLTPTDLLQLRGCSDEGGEGDAAGNVPIVVSKRQISRAIKIGAGVGTGVGMGVASATGACIGGLTGALLLGSVTAGIGAGVGLVAGAAAGAAAGVAVGPFVGLAVKKVHDEVQKKTQKKPSS